MTVNESELATLEVNTVIAADVRARDGKYSCVFEVQRVRLPLTMLLMQGLQRSPVKRVFFKSAQKFG